MDDIIDHQKNTEAIEKKDGWTRTQRGISKRVITTKGWDLKIQWKDGTSKIGRAHV